MALDPQLNSRSLFIRAAPRSRRPPIREFVRAALSRDFVHATELALVFLAQTESRTRLFSDLFHAAQQHIEERWHGGEATVSDEYAVYLAIEAALAALPDPLLRDAPPGAPTILLGTLAPEEHDLGLRLLAASFADVSWNVDVRVGVGGADLIEHAVRDKRRVVGISATFLSRRARAELAATVNALKAAGMLVLAGGAAFSRSPALGQQLGVDLVATDSRFAVLYVNRLVRRPEGSRRLLSEGRARP